MQSQLYSRHRLFCCACSPPLFPKSSVRPSSAAIHHESLILLCIFLFSVVWQCSPFAFAQPNGVESSTSVSTSFSSSSSFPSTGPPTSDFDTEALLSPTTSDPQEEEAQEANSADDSSTTSPSLEEEYLFYGTVLEDGTVLPPLMVLDFDTAQIILSDSDIVRRLPPAYLVGVTAIEMNAILGALSPEYAGPYRLTYRLFSRPSPYYPPWYYDTAMYGLPPGSRRSEPDFREDSNLLISGNSGDILELQKYRPKRLPFRPVYATVEYSPPPVIGRPLPQYGDVLKGKANDFQKPTN